ncbi:MAG: hypothetical protein ABL892_12785 [Thiobacillaceae bacterium]
MRYFILVSSIVLLAGCALSPAQREAREAAHLQELARVCEKIGFAPGSEQNKECVVKLLAAEIAQPTIVDAPYRPIQTICNTVGKRVICHSF